MRLQNKMKMKNIIGLITLALMLQSVAVQASSVEFEFMGGYLLYLHGENSGMTQDVPFITSQGDKFKFGTDSKDLVFIEGKINQNGSSNSQDFTIGHLDSFVLSQDHTTQVMLYRSYNWQNNELELTNVLTGNNIYVIISTVNPVPGTIGSGDIVVDGTTYKVYAANVSSGTPPLSVDQNANGIIDSEIVDIKIETGESLLITDANQSRGGTWNPHTMTWDNNGAGINSNKTFVRLFTPANTFGQGLPANNTFVEILFEDDDHIVEIVEVSGVDKNGNPFSLSGTTQYVTHYHEMFDMYASYCGTSGFLRSLEIIPWYFSPEFSISYDPNLRDLEVKGIGAQNGNVSISMNGLSLWNGYEQRWYTAEDTHGNTASLSLVYRDKNGKIKMHLNEIGYAGKLPSKIPMTNEFSVERANGHLLQKMVVLPNYEISVDYDKNQNKSIILYQDRHSVNNYTSNGPILLELRTNQGALEYSTL